jgi:hypothetical protein
VMKNMVLNRDADELVTVRTEKKIKRKGNRNVEVEGCIQITTEPEGKIYKVCFNKRLRLDDNTSVPNGYINY